MIRNGGPAFPSAQEFKLGDYATSGHSGMTMRQWYKGMALAGIMGNIEYIQNSNRELASIASDAADALLREDEEHEKGKEA